MSTLMMRPGHGLLGHGRFPMLVPVYTSAFLETGKRLVKGTGADFWFKNYRLCVRCVCVCVCCGGIQVQPKSFSGRSQIKEKFKKSPKVVVTTTLDGQHCL